MSRDATAAAVIAQLTGLLGDLRRNVDQLNVILTTEVPGDGTDAT